MARPDNLKTRSEFLRVQNRGCKSVAAAFVLQGCFRDKPSSARPNHPRTDSAPAELGWRVGYTASKRVGNAVCRNRAKRRLRALVRTDMAKWARADIDYVLIARANLAEKSCPLSSADLQQSLAVLHRKLDKKIAKASNKPPIKPQNPATNLNKDVGTE